MRSIASASAIVAILCSACTEAPAAGDKAGAPAEPIVLELAVADGDLGNAFAVGYFVRRVSATSGGSIRVELDTGLGNWARDAEVQVVRAVASGDVDLGVTSTGVFDSMGLTSFQALSAPMLIDRYGLVDALLESAIPREMLDDLTGVGVTGLGMSFQSLPHPLSEDQPLLAPADWNQIGFGTHRSVVQEQTIRALGGRPVEVFGPTRDQALDTGRIQAFDFGVFGYTSEFRTGMGRQVPYVAENVVLWPQFNVLIADPHLLASLSAQQRVWLQGAANEATTFSEGLVGREERYVKNACAIGVRFAIATPSELAAMRSALDPVYRRIERDPQTEKFIHQIGNLKRTTPVGPAIKVPPDCVGTRRH